MLKIVNISEKFTNRFSLKMRIIIDVKVKGNVLSEFYNFKKVTDQNNSQSDNIGLNITLGFSLLSEKQIVKKQHFCRSKFCKLHQRYGSKTQSGHFELF